MAKKLKKKHTPLSFVDWGETTGATVAAVTAAETLVTDPDKFMAIAADEECRRVAKAMSDAHHAYLCAFISNLLEKP